ncbi:MAG: hypothetical protein QM496_14080 [Verrucomicrobiota bacterium]
MFPLKATTLTSLALSFLVASLSLQLLAPSATCREDTAYADLTSPAHQYWTRPLNDPFSKLIPAFESGKIKLDTQNQLAFVTSLLKALDIPASSQMLVFSTTSLQLSKISPRNPRALYFNEDLYLGYIPGGKIEIISIDPQLGGIFYIFEIPRGQGTPQPQRAKRCMNCHADTDTRHVPGLVIKSVIPGPNGGSLNSFRREQSGHQIPLEDRFGGWHLTGADPIKKHWGNLIGQLSPAGLKKQIILPGQLFDFNNYPLDRSDLLPQLLHEHQVGFINRVVEAGYKYRAYQSSDQAGFTTSHTKEIEQITHDLARYLLFADEAQLPRGIQGDARFKKDFRTKRKTLASGESLKDLDLDRHLFKYRCSYMIYSNAFQGLPKKFKQQIYQKLGKALSTENPDPNYSYLPSAEKRIIKKLLQTTLPK